MIVAAILEQQLWERKFALGTGLDQSGKRLEATEEALRVTWGWIISLAITSITYIFPLWHRQSILYI